jgi:hypothetical protein
LEAEEIDKIRIQELNFQISKIKRDIEKISVGVSVSDPLPNQQSKEFASYKEIESSSFREVTSESQPKNVKMTLLPNTEEKEKIVKKKKTGGSQGITDPLDTSSSGIGFSEDELLSMKPFEPYKETDGDDLLALKMEMLRNRHKSATSGSSLKKIESLPSDSKDEKSFDVQTESDPMKNFIPHAAADKPTQGSPEIGSENTAFSSRRLHNKNPPPPPLPKVDQGKDLLTSKVEEPSKSIEIIQPRVPTEDSLPPTDNKIAKLRQELAENDESEDEENEQSENEEEVDIQLKELRAEALTLEKNSETLLLFFFSLLLC